jgi:hypothetical protein
MFESSTPGSPMSGSPMSESQMSGRMTAEAMGRLQWRPGGIGARP